ncbi:MAG: hypothetical protein Q8O90_01735, partial [Elusimicrobiota bacterium]|nr:hypothetical protein [Elusimicrobiota bacterium]
PALLARLSRKLNVIIEEVKFSDSLAIASEVALFTLIEVPQDLEALLKKLEGLEARLASGAAPELPPAGGQKKNEGLTSTDNQETKQRPLSPTVTVPVPAPADAWKKMLGQISSKRPSLYNIMLSVKIVFAEENKWRLLSANEFETAMIEKARPDLEELLERFAGRKIILAPEYAKPGKEAPAAREEEVMQAPGEEETIVEDSIEAEAAQEPQPAPKASGPREVSAGSEPEFKHLSKVFHGRITKISKVK